VHVARSGLLVAAAVAFAVLAVTARGPLGLIRVCGPRLHATLDVAVALVLAAAPAIPALRPDATGIVVVEVAALAWLRLATLTRYRRPATGGAGPGGDGVVSGAVVRSRAPESDGRPTAGTPVAHRLGMLAGRSARRLPAADDAITGGARAAGRIAGGLTGRVARNRRTPS